MGSDREAARIVELRCDVAEGRLRSLLGSLAARAFVEPASDSSSTQGGTSGPASGPDAPRPKRAVYYDTPQLDLHRAGLVLRLREAEPGPRQTVEHRQVTRGGLFERSRSEGLVAGSEPDLDRVADPRAREALEAATHRRRRPLEPVVETLLTRVTHRVVTGESEITACVESGEARTRAGSVPISSLSLALRSGRRSDLFDLALALQAEVPLVPAHDRPHERGMALLTGAVRPPRKASRPRVGRDATLDDVIAAVVSDGLAQIHQSQPAAALGEDPEGVHQLRVGARRLRSALAVFSRSLPPSLVSALKPELRWLGGALGRARDLDVLTSERLDPLLARSAGDGGLKRLRDEAGAVREEAYRSVRQALDSDRFSRLVLVLGRLHAARGWREQPLSPEAARLFAPARDSARKQLRKRHGRALALGRDLDRLGPAELHRLRIELKKLRYCSEFLGGLFPGRGAARFGRRLARLQDVLGHLNDGAVAERLLGELIERLGPEAGPAHQRAAGLVVGWVSHEGQTAVDDLSRCWDRFVRTPAFWDRRASRSKSSQRR